MTATAPTGDASHTAEPGARRTDWRAFHRTTPSPADARGALRTLRDVLRWSVSRFEAAGLAWGQGTGNARDEAAWLLLWSLHLPPDELDFWLDCRLTGSEIDAALALVERRCSERVPAAWLTGEAWLRGVRFLCDHRALVPRSLIAESLEGSLDEWLAGWLADKPYASGAVVDEESPLHVDPDLDADERPRWPTQVLDLCTGAASLAILAALRFPETRVTASDISAEALALAADNVAMHGLQARVRLLRGDLFEAVPGQRFDLILCNPPYVNAASMAALPPEFRAEPAIALDGGPDGMDFVRRLLAEAAEHLDEHGVLVIEIGHEAANFEKAFPGLHYDWLPVCEGERMVVAIARPALVAQGAPVAHGSAT